MELNHEFRVDEEPPHVWAVLTDIVTIAPCLPGAELQEVDGEEYRGVVKVKLGPITAQYKGVARFVERDDEALRAVLRAEGRETRGQGNANATITAQLSPDGDGTRVSVATDLTITGRVAQFGRGVLADVSAKLLGQFADCLQRKMSGDSPDADDARDAPETGSGPGEASADEAPAEAGPIPASTTPGAAESAGPAQPVEPVDLLEAAGAPVAKRVIPAVIAVLVGLFLFRRRRRSHR